MLRGMNMKQSLVSPKPKVKAARQPEARRLLVWYDEHRRILPWRALSGVVPDPYRVWLSEIMLQQTTVAAVGPYFQKFIKRWPTVKRLAKAKRMDVMRMWAGLGYYRRATLLHECAKIICAKYDGRFPETEVELRALPGFGPYTTAAVSAIAFDQRANVVDGNVERVMARLFSVKTPLPWAKDELRKLAATLLPSARYGDYAQALMDLGATICTPRNPKCGLCPWTSACRARAENIAGTLPYRVKAKERPVRRGIAFVLVNKKNGILLRQRPNEGLLAGMMEVPSSEWREGVMPQLDDVKKEMPARVKWTLLPGSVTHVFSHFELELAVAVAASTRPVKGTWVPFDRLKEEALPSVMRKIVQYALTRL
jgi:A/G-specific adenine glycosylase